MRQIILRPSTQEDKETLPWVDYSTLTSLVTCPRWGIIHSLHGKRFQTNGREMALEAGTAMHDMFAAVRMFELMEHVLNSGNVIRSYGENDVIRGNIIDGLKVIPAYIYNHGRKLFRSALYPDRWEEAMQIFDQPDDYDTRMMRFALYILETSGFHDDPSDRRRTQTNLETAAIAYIDRYPKRRYIPFTNADRAFVGVEIGIDVVLATAPTFRFIGKIDGLCHDTMSHGELGIHENKTGSRIDSVWADSFTVGHQPTGYMAAISSMLATEVRTGVAWGTQLPVPKSSMFGDGSMRIPIHRNDRQISEWFDWIQHILTTIVVPHYDAPTDAPMYTHSCNRYFRSCSLIPLCAEEPEQRREIFENEMVYNRWSPLEELEKEKDNA